MSSWIFLFSKFTSEALLFEVLGIFLLITGYAGFYVLRKRRIGSIEHTIPVGVVKDYLNVLIGDAQQLRAQLFGLLAEAGVPASMLNRSPLQLGALGAGGALDPAIAQKVGLLEAKMSEQAKSMEALLGEKAKLEQELSGLKTAGGGSKGAAADAAAMAELRKKIELLEGKLAEYSVIEDDLSNLKRLQQENAQLRAALAGQGGTVAVAAATAAQTNEAATAAPAQDAPVQEAAPPEAPAAAAPAAETPAPAAFETAVDQVEQAIAPAAAEAAPAAPEAVAAAAPAAAPETAPAAPAAASENAAATAPPAAAASGEKSDADLLSEFEKMLSS